jgi:rhomboid family GlyGly-CTERM serine protease
MASLDPVKQGRAGWRRVLASLNGDGRYGIALACTCALLLLPVLTGDAGREALRYDRLGLAHGELWRLLTGHLVHLSFEHAALNSLGLVLMWALFARDYAPRHWLPIVLGSIAAIDAGLWLRDSTIAWYVGSSGALHGMMAAGTLAHVRRRDLDGWLLAAFLILKLSYEQFSGQLPFAEGSVVVVDAHLYGALGGVAVAAWYRPRSPG